ncbi:hypothetical protein XAB3213_2640020 [Xanthomonas citri pv. bilvae]|nr:hypothetical protein XAB3213_2640020 [Xanthomonas citri pv. bilvae]
MIFIHEKRAAMAAPLRQYYIYIAALKNPVPGATKENRDDGFYVPSARFDQHLHPVRS